MALNGTHLKGDSGHVADHNAVDTLLSSHTSSIQQNTTNIQQNTTNIGTNTASIGTINTALLTKKNLDASRVQTLMDRMFPPGTPAIASSTTVAADTPTVTSGTTATITARMYGVQSGNVTEVGSRGTWNSTFGRLPVSGKSGLDFVHTGTACEIHFFSGFTGSMPYQIFVNGVPVTATPSTIAVTASTDYYVKLTFSGSARRRIEFFAAHSGSWYEVRCALADVIAQAPRKPVVAFVGDSFWDSSSGTLDLQTGNFMLARMLGVECFSQSHGGTGYTVAGSFDKFGDSSRVSAVSAANPELIVLQGSVNDDGATGIQTAAAACFAAYATACPNAKLIVFGPPPTDATSTLSANRQTNNAAVRAAAIAAPNVLAFHDMIGNATSTPAAFATFQTYADGTLLSSLGSVWKVSNGGASYAGGPVVPGGAAMFALQTYVYTGTGKVGSTASDGNRDTLLYSDGIHPMPEASAAFAAIEAAAIWNDLLTFARAA
jgi:hypothetical protein